MSTQDVARLAPGASAYAAFLNAKGHLLADAHVLAREEDISTWQGGRQFYLALTWVSFAGVALIDGLEAFPGLLADRSGTKPPW